MALVTENGGRVSLKDMASHIGVGIEVIEPVVINLCRDGHGELLNGAMITGFYLDQIMIEISELVLD